MAKILRYSGKALANGDSALGLNPYVPSAALVKAVNLALFLKQRPLLLMGEPGVGKTCLAESVAYELLGAEKMKDFYFRWNIKSTSKAKDGLYRYDTFNRLADAQIFKTTAERKQLNNLSLGAADSYIQPGYLAEAFRKSTKETRSVILIDEIDKADIDFPNDLLNELENFEFTITETGEEVKRAKDFEYPVIIISSNRERELPPAFLRRCLYHFIDFPDDDVMADIISRSFQPVDTSLVRKVLDAFKAKRSTVSETEKKPSTSELLDWFKVIHYYSKLKDDEIKGEVMPEEDQIMIRDLDLLDTENIPYAEVLLKTYETYTSSQNK